MLRRKELGFTQKDLGDKADMNRDYLSLIEAGKKEISILTLSKIASALEVSVGSLLGESAAPPSAAFDPSDVDSFLAWCDRNGYAAQKLFKAASWLFQSVGSSEIRDTLSAMETGSPIHLCKFTADEQAEYDDAVDRLEKALEKAPSKPDGKQKSAG